MGSGGKVRRDQATTESLKAKIKDKNPEKDFAESAEGGMLGAGNLPGRKRMSEEGSRAVMESLHETATGKPKKVKNPKGDKEAEKVEPSTLAEQLSFES